MKLPHMFQDCLRRPAFRLAPAILALQVPCEIHHCDELVLGKLLGDLKEPIKQMLFSLFHLVSFQVLAL